MIILSLHPSWHSLWSRNMATLSTTMEKHRCILSVVYVWHIMNFLEGPHLKWRGPQMYWPATTQAHHPYHTSHVHWPHRTCWSIHGPQPSAQTQCGPLYRDLNRRSGRPRQTWLSTVESDVAPLNIGLATACHRAQNWQAWRSLVEMAMSTGQATWWWVLA